MPVRVEQMTSEVAATAGALPLTEAQIEKLVQIILRRLAGQERNDRYGRAPPAQRPRRPPGAPPERRRPLLRQDHLQNTGQRRH